MSSEQRTFDFDVAILGGGSGGYAAARTAAGAGLKTVVIEGGREVGGLCILRGCMPTKALLYAAEVRHLAESANWWGMKPAEVPFDWSAVMARKDGLIKEFTDYRVQQLSGGKFEFIRANASFTDPHTVALSDGRKLSAKHFVISTGSIVSKPPLPQLAAVGYLTSDDALALKKLPKSMIVLGGGAVAVEFAQIFARFGVEVTLIQRSGQILREFDADGATVVEGVFRREGIQVFTDTGLIDAFRDGRMKAITFLHRGQKTEVKAEEILFALGRSPNTASLALDQAGVTTEQGRILTNDQIQTSAPHIYAAGDCTGPYEIVHIAIQQGEIAAQNIATSLQSSARAHGSQSLLPETKVRGEGNSSVKSASSPRPSPPSNGGEGVGTPALDRGVNVRAMQPRRIDYRLLISIVFTEPQVATVGLTEKEAAAQGVPFLAASYPFNDHGKSLIMEAKDGFVKLLADPKTGEILGGACVGPVGGELIHEIVLAMAKRMTVHELAATPHYHPTLAEIWTYPAEELAEKILL